MLDFVATLGRVYGREAQPALRDEFRPGDFRHLFTDASRLRALGWEAQVELEEGLRRYADWIRTQGTVEEYFSAAERLLRLPKALRPQAVAGGLY